MRALFNYDSSYSSFYFIRKLKLTYTNNFSFSLDGDSSGSYKYIAYFLFVSNSNSLSLTRDCNISGPLPKIPIIVKARFFSREAEMKIKAVGGVCIVTA